MSKAPPAPAAGPRYMTLQEVADELGVARTTIYNRIYEGDLVGVTVGKKGRGLRVLRSSFDEYTQRIEREGHRRFGGAA
jgi:excisionase family DNA binding protein